MILLQNSRNLCFHLAALVFSLHISCHLYMIFLISQNKKQLHEGQFVFWRMRSIVECPFIGISFEKKIIRFLQSWVIWNNTVETVIDEV